MNVSELIEKLQRCPQDAQVLTSDNESGHENDPEVWLVDAWLGESYPGGREEVRTDARQLRTYGPNCKAVVISHFGEDGERL